MVDAVDLLFAEEGSHGGVDALRGGEVVAERFFQHDAGCGAVQPGGGQVAADGHEIVRRGRKVNHQGAAVLPGFGAEQRGEVVELFGVFGVYGQVVDALAEGMPRFGFEVGNMRPGRFLNFFQVAFAS